MAVPGSTSFRQWFIVTFHLIGKLYVFNLPGQSYTKTELEKRFQDAAGPAFSSIFSYKITTVVQTCKGLFLESPGCVY